MAVAGAFFGGMEENREALMGKRPHFSTTYILYSKTRADCAAQCWKCSGFAKDTNSKVRSSRRSTLIMLTVKSQVSEQA